MDQIISGIIHHVVLLSAFAMLWFLCLFCLFPIGLGAVDPVTGAPSKPRLGMKMLCATLLAVVLWLGFYATIRFGWVNL